MILEGVSMGTINHQNLFLVFLLKSLFRGFDACSIVVGAFTPSAENDEAVFVAGGAGDGC